MVERLVWDQEVAGSNPVTPIALKLLMVIDLRFALATVKIPVCKRRFPLTVFLTQNLVGHAWRALEGERKD